MRITRLLARVAGGVLVAGAIAPLPAHAGFLQTAVDSNGHGYFTENGSRWRGVGFNDYRVMNYPNSICGQGMSMEDDFFELDRIADTGANVIRTWFFQKYYQDAPAGDKWHAFTHILQAAQNRGMKVIPVLTNHWKDCDRENYADHHHPAEFYSYQYANRLSGGQAANGYDYTAKEWAAMVAKHFNPDSGLASTIAYFQISNEAEINTTGSSTDCEPNGRLIMRNFADDMATTIKNAYVDGVPGRNPPLVSLGTMGIGQCGVSTTNSGTPNPNDTDFKYIHAGNVDLCEVHDYDAMNKSSASYNWYGLAYNNLNQRLSDCGTKPLVIGEAGLPANVSATSVDRKNDFKDSPSDAGYDKDATAGATTLATRATFLDNKMTAAFNSGVAAYLPWDKITNRSAGSWNHDQDESFGYGAHGVGNAMDPAMCVIKAFTPAQNCTTNPINQPPSPALHFDFEDGIEGWATNYGWGNLATYQTGYVHHRNSGALAIGIGSNHWSTIENEGDSVGALEPGDQVSMWVYSEADTSAVSFQPILRINSGWDTVFGTAINPTNSTWTKLTITVPSNANAVHALGLQVNDDNGAGAGKYVHLDDITW